MATYWTVSQLAEYCGVSRSTIQKRANDYSWALSEEASPGKGKERHFTAGDAAVMSEIENQAKSGVLHEQIRLTVRTALDAGEFDQVDGFPFDDEPPLGTVSIVEYERQMAKAEMLVLEYKGRVEKAEQEWHEARETIAELKGQISQMRRADRTEEMTEEIVRLNREIGRLEYQLELA